MGGNGISRWTPLGLLLSVIVTAASVQDRDGAKPVLELLAASFQRIRCGFRRNGAPRPEVLEQLFRRFWCGAVAWGRSVSDGLAAGSPPLGLCGC